MSDIQVRTGLFNLARIQKAYVFHHLVYGSVQRII